MRNFTSKESKQPARKSLYVHQFFHRRYAQVPMEILLDSRLTNSDKLAMVAILLYADAESCFTKPLTLQTLVEVTGLAAATLSRSTTTLAKIGYLQKKQAGYNEPNIYQVLCPDYDDDALRHITDKRVSDEEYAQQRSRNSIEHGNSIVRLTNLKAETVEMSWHALKQLFKQGLRLGFDSVGFAPLEFERLGFKIVGRE